MDRIVSRKFPRLTTDRAALLAFSVLILFVYREFLLSPWSAGWDTLPQIHLFIKMARLLKQGMVFGYDLEWFGGFPIFIFYGFFPYLIAASIHLLSGGLIPIFLLAKLTIVASAILLLTSVYHFLGAFFGKEYRLPGMIVFQAFLFFPLNPHMGVGLGGGVHHGLFQNLFGASLILLSLVCLEKHRHTNRPCHYISAVLLYVAVLFSHAISSAFGALIISAYFWSHRRFKQWIIFVLSVFCLSLFYLYPYFRYSNYTNASMISSSYLTFMRLIGFNWPFEYNLAGPKDFFRSLPLYALFLLAVFFIGAVKLVLDKNFFLPTTVVLYLTLIPSNLIFKFVGVPMHSYRFHSFFLIVYLLISAYGVQFLLGLLDARWTGYGRAANALLLILLAPLVLSFTYRGEIVNWQKNSSADRAAMEYIHSLNPTGRVFIERSIGEPNPHLFSVYLPYLYRLPVILGLLIESSDNSRYIVPPVITVSENLVWGGTTYTLADLPYERVLDKIGDLGVEYLAFNRASSITALADHLLSEGKQPTVELVHKIDPHVIVRKKNFLPLLSLLKHEPILCINRHPALSNEEIITMFYRSPLSPDVKLSFVDKEKSWPSKETMNQFTNLLIIPGADSDGTYEGLREFRGKNIVFFFDGVFTPPANPALTLGSAKVRFATFSQYQDVVTFLEQGLGNKGQAEAIEPEFVSDTKIVFTAVKPTVVNIGYFPYWQANPGPIFRLTPSKLLVFSKGRTTLEFRLPAAQKGLMGFSLAALVGLTVFTYRSAKRRTAGAV